MRAKSRLILASPLLIPAQARPALSKLIRETALELESDIKLTISTSIPRGRTYRSTAIVRSRTPARAVKGLRRRGKGFIVGANFHRASAKGQAPAIDTGQLISSIRTKHKGQLRVVVGSSVYYGEILDDPAGLDRPFFMSTVAKNRDKYLARIRRGFQKLL